MSLNNRDRQILEHIIRYCEKIQLTVQRFGADLQIFINDPDYRDSVGMNLLQIGELAHNGLDEAFSSPIPTSHGDRFTVCAIVLRMIMRESVCKLSGKPSPKISLC